MHNSEEQVATRSLGEKLLEYLADTRQSQAAFGQRLGLSQSRISQLIKGGGTKNQLDAEKVLDASRETGWRITPHDWRPDLYPHPDDGMPKTNELPLAAAAPG